MTSITELADKVEQVSRIYAERCAINRDDDWFALKLTEEAGDWQPGAERYVGPIAYATASAIGLARVYQRVHWMSDLPLAAAIGTWSGLSVESHSHHARHGNAMRRIINMTMVEQTADGETLVGWSIPFVATDP